MVQPATPAQAISISGSDTVTQFSSIQLTATVDPAEATGTYAWSSSNEDILTVDNSGNVTGVRQGTATVTVSFRSAADGSVVSASKDVTVTATGRSNGSSARLLPGRPHQRRQLERLRQLGSKLAWHREGEYHWELHGRVARIAS